MPHRYSRLIPFISLTGDLLFLNLIFIAGFWYSGQGSIAFGTRYLLFYFLLNVTWFLLASIAGALSLEQNSKKTELFFIYFKTSIFFLFLFLLFLQLFDLQYLSATFTLGLIVAFFTFLTIWKFGLYFAFMLYRRFGFNYRTVLIIGSSEKTRDLARFFSDSTWHGYKLVGILDISRGKNQTEIGVRLEKVLRNQHVDELYLNWYEMSPREKEAVTRLAVAYPLKIRIIPDLGTFSLKTSEMVSYGSIPVIQIHQGPLVLWYNRLLKRVVDLLISLVVVVTVLPGAAFLIFLASGLGRRGSIWYRQQRTANDGNVFWCLKFRTMTAEDNPEGIQATVGDRRVTRLGRFLRKSSLDELPQFVNVLRGEMSVVGPRPHMLCHTESYRKLVSSFMLRHTVKPGITGLAQVSGYRGEIKSQGDLEKRVEFDVRYIENWTFNLDLKIMLLTAWYMVRGQKEAY